RSHGRQPRRARRRQKALDPRCETLLAAADSRGRALPGPGQPNRMADAYVARREHPRPSRLRCRRFCHREWTKVREPVIDPFRPAPINGYPPRKISQRSRKRRTSGIHWRGIGPGVSEPVTRLSEVSARPRFGRWRNLTQYTHPPSAKFLTATAFST